MRHETLSDSFTHAGAAGANTLRFAGRLRGRTLKPGRYRLQALAPGAPAPVRAPFVLARRR